MPSSIKKAIKNLAKKLKNRTDELNNIKRISKNFEEKMEQVKIIKEERKSEQKESFLRNHPNGLDRDTIEKQSKTLFINLENLSAKTLGSITARYGELQSAIDRIPDEDIKGSMQELPQIYRSFLEEKIRFANEFSNQMKAMFTQLESEDLKAIRAFWSSTMEIAILSEINATGLDNRKSGGFLSTISRLRDEILDDSPDLQCAFYWWLKSLKEFYQSYQYATLRISDSLKNA